VFEYGFRTDVGTLRPPKRLPDGRLRVDAHITRPGIFTYPDKAYPNGIRKELREDSEVFDPASMESASQVPVTHEHPPTMLTADNAKKYMVGMTGERVARDDNHIMTSLMIAERPTIDAIEAGDVQVSAGYACRLDMSPGVHPVYGEYDVRQTMIRYNHIATAVGRGRAGTARVRMDAELTADERNNLPAKSFAAPDGGLPINDAVHVRGAMARFNQEKFPDSASKQTAYNKIVAAGKKFGVDTTGFAKEFGGRFDAGVNHHGGGAMDPEKQQETIRALNAQLKTAEERADTAEKKAKEETHRADSADGKLQVAEKQITELQAKITTAVTAGETAAVQKEKERADSLQQQVTRFDSTFRGAVKARAKLERIGMIHLGDSFRMDDLTDRQVMVEVVKRLDSACDVGASVPDGKIEGIFDYVVGQASKNARSLAAVSEILATSQANAHAPRTDAKEKNTLAARDAWKQPLSNDPRGASAGGK